MNLAKRIIEVIWPIIYVQLEELAASTDNRFDDIALEAVNAAIEKFLLDE